MTDKKLKVSNAAYTELAIQIATLSMKVDKILELLNKPEVTIDQDIRFIAAKPGHGASYIGIIDGPWASPDVTPNCIEGTGPCKCSDNLKAELQSDNENFEDNYK